MLRVLKFIAEFIAAIVAVVTVVTLLVVWRLSEKPLSSDFMTPYIEAGVEAIVPGSQFKAADTLLLWDNVEHTILLHVDNIKILNMRGEEIADIPNLRAKISVIGLMLGQFYPRDMVVEHPQIKLQRLKNGTFAFGGLVMGNGNDQDARPITDILHNALQNLTHTALLHRLAVNQADFEVHDDVTGKEWSIGVPEISVKRVGLREVDDKLQIGTMEGHMTVEVTQKEAIAKVGIEYSYSPETHLHTLSSTIDSLTPAYLAGGHPETLGLGLASIIDLPLTGKITLSFDNDLIMDDLAVELHGDKGQIVYSDFWDKPLSVKSFDANIDYARATHHLEIHDTTLDLGDATLDLDIKGSTPSDEKMDENLVVDMTVDHLPMNRYAEVWPKPVLPDPRYWLESNLRDGSFDHAELHMTGALAWNDLANMTVNDGSGKVLASHAQVTYLDGMPAAEDVSAVASFDLKKMQVQITNGGIGAIRMQPFTIDITGLADTDQNIHIPLQFTGPLPDILRLLDHEPLQYAKKLGIAPEDLQGSAQGMVDFKFPLLKTLLMKDVDLHATATATNAASPKLVPGIAIDQGNVTLELTMSGFMLKGQANLNKIPFQVGWQENFEAAPNKAKRTIDVSGVIRDNQWNNFGIDSFDGSKGPMNVALELKRMDKKKLLISGTVDMTPSATQVDLIGWKKPVNAPAILKFTATAPDNEDVEVDNFTIKGDHVRASGTATFSSDMSTLLALETQDAVVGRTNASLTYSKSEEDGSIDVEAMGASLDISGLHSASSSAQIHGEKYTISVGKLYTSGDGEIDHADGTAVRDQNGWTSISLHGFADGDKPLSIELTPQDDGHRTLLISCDNFGEMMQGMGLTDTVKGGTLKITGQSTVDQPQLVSGHIKVTDFNVEKLPVLALLLNATSPFGFADLLTNSASFSRLESDFTWQGDSVTLMKAHAAGSSMGINADGKININTGEANLQGTLVPFGTVNKIINSIPLIGDLLTGGENQGVLAVSYQIKGSLNNPKVSVNPVSLLTPGFIRNLFFSDSDSSEN